MFQGLLKNSSVSLLIVFLFVEVRRGLVLDCRCFVDRELWKAIGRGRIEKSIELYVIERCSTEYVKQGRVQPLG